MVTEEEVKIVEDLVFRLKEVEPNLGLSAAMNYIANLSMEEEKYALASSTMMVELILGIKEYYKDLHCSAEDGGHSLH